ncbi:Heavy metal RND efflux outer membrane protein, CzcC family [Granulicella sibirica]|uniref:Heavy metal RND efflux outer membrane protein, CzcC family n=2 Tax=Granulicella sibirica TaxID=2479048 RepID=A0A4Q0T2J9_9BACT|nr:Heavy metal RND efflux outer membrane protein, CzcC family [Granulicella sibirica]
MVGPKYVKPAVPMAQAPDAYKETDPNWKPASPSDTALKGDWWLMFNEPVLNDLEVKVAASNQSLKVAEARFREARSQIRINRASLYPTIGTAPTVQGIHDANGRPYFTAPVPNNGLADLQLPIDFSYEVDLWGRIRRTVNIAKEETQASAADLATAQLSLQAEVALDYFEIRSADAQKKLLSDTVNDYREALRITTNRFEGGVTSEADVYQAKTQLQAAIVQESDIMVQRAQFEHAIAVLIGQPPASFSLAEAPLNTMPPYIPTGLPSELLERRPDIAAAERRTNEANERIGIARAAYFPSLTFSAAAGFESTAIASLFNASNYTYALGPTLAETFFDAGRRAGVSEQARASFDEASANYRQTSLTAYQQVEDNLAVLRILQQEADQQHAATDAARGAQQIFNNRYVGGVDTYLQVVTAQTTALLNERNDIDILRRRMDASVLLVKALGGGWDTNQLPKY